MSDLFDPSAQSDDDEADVYHIQVGGHCVAHTVEFVEVVRWIRAAGGAGTFDANPGKGWTATGSDGKLIVVTKTIGMRKDEWLD